MNSLRYDLERMQRETAKDDWHAEKVREYVETRSPELFEIYLADESKQQEALDTFVMEHGQEIIGKLGNGSAEFYDFFKRGYLQQVCDMAEWGAQKEADAIDFGKPDEDRIEIRRVY